MNIQFATCSRHNALGFIKRVYPDRDITDTLDCAAPLLDFVEKDIVRIQDPMMHGSRIGIVPGKKWVEDADTRLAIISAAKLLSGESE